MSNNRFVQIVGYYYQLTKPSIMLLVVFSSAVALSITGIIITNPLDFLLILFAVYLTGGSANALNQYFERDVDAQMERTKHRRPLPSKKISPTQALVFSVIIGIAGVLIFIVYFNWLSAALSLATILFYSLFYTLWLKPTTPQNIVIGGAAGAMAPIGAVAAVTGRIEIEAVLLFAIVFFWTPPHFWSLAIHYKDDYDKVGYPMMPNARGVEETMKQIVLYTIVMVLTSLFMAYIFPGVAYTIAAVLLGIIFLKKTWTMYRYNRIIDARGIFGYSIVYLFALFIGVIIDSFFINSFNLNIILKSLYGAVVF